MWMGCGELLAGTEFDLASAENTTIENAPTDTTAFGISGGAITKDQKIRKLLVKDHLRHVRS